MQRAQAMDFSLAEIAQRLAFRASPRRARPKVRELARNKLAQVSTRLHEFKALRNELLLLLNLCPTRTVISPNGLKRCWILRNTV